MLDQKQKLIIENLISSSDLFIKCYSIIKPEYFHPDFRIAVSFILDYYDKYSAIPDEKTIYAESDLKLEKHKISKDAINYTSDEIEKHCQIEAMSAAVLSAAALITQGKKDQVLKLIEEAELVGLKRDIGLDYFLDPEERLNRLATEEDYQSTGLDGLDKLLGGGLVRKQMSVLSGNAGTGKSISLSNISLNLLEDKLNVLYITLELSESLVSLRYDGLITNFDQTGWQDRIKETAIILNEKNDKLGTLVIKYMESGTPTKVFKSYLKEFELEYGFLPDVLVVDYLDIMGANSGISSEKVFEKDKQVSEELRNLANQYNFYLLTASQQNRSAVGLVDIDQSHIAGGISKANTADFWFSIILTDQMKLEGIIIYKCLKSRSSDGVGKSNAQSWNNRSLKIGNLNNDGDSEIKKRVLAEKQDKIILDDINTDVKSLGLDSNLADIINL